jgi:signal transduction histidine kinase
MQGKTNVVRLLRIAAVLLLVYVVLLAAIDYILHIPSPLRWSMYVFDIGIILFLFGLTFWPGIQKQRGKWFLPIVIVLVSALPTIFDQIVIRYILSGPLPSPEATLFRVVPFLLMALILVAWQYHWQHIVFFTAVIGLINAGIVWVYEPATKGGLSSGLFAVMTQVFAFLVVGLFIGFMVNWLHNQQRSLEEANAKLTNYAQTLEDLAITKERSRIAQELHDALSHTLSGLSVQLETMKAYWEVDPLTARKRLDKSLAAARSGLDETRRILMALRAKPLEELGLVPAIRQMADEAASRTGLNLKLEITDNIPALPPNIEQCLFRVAQEAITNVLKHAKAQELIVKLQYQECKVTLTVQDNGIGFNTETNNGFNHFGLLGMKERVDFIKGDLKIISQPGAGTIVKLTV